MSSTLTSVWQCDYADCTSLDLQRRQRVSGAFARERDIRQWVGASALTGAGELQSCQAVHNAMTIGPDNNIWMLEHNGYPDKC